LAEWKVRSIFIMLLHRSRVLIFTESSLILTFSFFVFEQVVVGAVPGGRPAVVVSHSDVNVFGSLPKEVAGEIGFMRSADGRDLESTLYDGHVVDQLGVLPRRLQVS
jgi:hypothetical protein